MTSQTLSLTLSNTAQLETWASHVYSKQELADYDWFIEQDARLRTTNTDAVKTAEKATSVKLRAVIQKLLNDPRTQRALQRKMINEEKIRCYEQQIQELKE